jgi:hypothetical protein
MQNTLKESGSLESTIEEMYPDLFRYEKTWGVRVDKKDVIRFLGELLSDKASTYVGALWKLHRCDRGITAETKSVIEVMLKELYHVEVGTKGGCNPREIIPIGLDNARMKQSGKYLEIIT